VRRLFILVALAAFAVAAYDVAAGGFYATVLGVRISSWEAFRPFAIGVAATSIALWLTDRDSAIPFWDRLARAAPALAAVATVLVVLAGIYWGAFVAGAADQYGYVSQSMRWASGHLTVSEPLAADFPDLEWVFTPLGYRPSTRVPGASVPTYAPGLPMAMAIAQKIAGWPALYLVVPLTGGLAIWLTFLLGRRAAGPRVGAIAAILVACSPIFLFQLMLPMSDVPVTMWWLLALVLVIADRPLVAGAAVSVAVLTRPNLVPLAIVMAIFLATESPRVARLLRFVAALIPGCLIVAAINWRLYGAPLKSGYGGLDSLFEWGRLQANVVRYSSWLVQAQSLAILLAMAAPLAVVSSRAADDVGIRDRRLVWLFLGFAAALALSYLFYIPFDDWTFLRFLLPAIPLLVVLAVSVVFRVLASAPLAWRGALVVAVFASMVCWSLNRAGDLGVFHTHESERRYVAVGEFVAGTLPQDAALLSMQESGSLRFYGHRLTLRWDSIPPARLGFLLDAIARKGLEPFIVLEEWEEASFRARFSGTVPAGRLDWPPMAEYIGRPRVRIYRVADRVRHVNGETIFTRRIQN
jgi:hypothetical protein